MTAKELVEKIASLLHFDLSINFVTSHDLESLLTAALEEAKNNEWISTTRSCEYHVDDLKQTFEKNLAEAKAAAFEEGRKSVDVKFEWELGQFAGRQEGYEDCAKICDVHAVECLTCDCCGAAARLAKQIRAKAASL